ncbi:MAG TPA: CDP-alcohol phosphatidyltransferase family protein [Chitinophagales bacterium]|nr:CDP-alcohol phosphatidyltransferase family protein [Chitinophagales bacterium]
MIRHIPNSLTLINLFFGSIGVFACATSNYKIVPICIAISLIADFLDGFTAKILKVKSELGAQLDSLADMVSFGVLPGTMFVQLISMSNMSGGGSYEVNPLAYLGFIFTLFACVRLAKFNLDTRQTESFIGLATPAATIFVLGLYLNFFDQDFTVLPSFAFKIIYQPLTMFVLLAAMSYLMISEIPMFSLKGNLFQLKGNEVQIGFLILSVVVLFTLQAMGLSVIIILYIIASLLSSMLQKARA